MISENMFFSGITPYDGQILVVVYMGGFAFFIKWLSVQTHQHTTDHANTTATVSSAAHQ
jgi:hypothetical protein